MKKLQALLLVMAILIATAGLIALRTEQAVAIPNYCDRVNCNTWLANCQAHPEIYCSGQCSWAGQSRWICPQALCGETHQNPWCVY